MADQVIEDDARADLAAEAERLHVLYGEGRFDEALAAVRGHQALLTAPAPSDADASSAPWTLREAILGLGAAAAHDLGRWEEALELNAAVRKSQEDRQAGAAERALTSFNDYSSLVRLHRAQEARELLLTCRDAFDSAGDAAMSANTLAALADTDTHLGQLARSFEQEADALRLRYRLADVEAIAMSHYNLAGYLIMGRQEPKDVWAHSLAAAVIHYQTDSPNLSASLELIARLVGWGSPGQQAPLSFEDVCRVMDGLSDVRFAELFAQLPARAATGQGTVDEIMRLTAEARDSAIEESVTAWEPIISAMVLAQQPDAPAEVAEALDAALRELRTEQVWLELVIVLHRIQAGPGFHSDHTVEDLDPVSSAVARRARAAIAGEVTVDPDAWRALLDES